MSAKELPKLTPPEFEIMDAVWKNGEMTATEIMNAVNGKSEKNLTRSTIQVQIARLEEKGWLRHQECGKKFSFSPTMPKEEALSLIVQDVRERVFGGSCAELVKALFDHGGVSPDELKKLRSIIDDYQG